MENGKYCRTDWKQRRWDTWYVIASSKWKYNSTSNQSIISTRNHSCKNKQNVDDNCQKKNGANNISVEQRSKRKAVIRTNDRLKTLFNEEIGTFVQCRKCHQDREIKHAIKDWQVTGTFKNIWLRNEKLQECFRIFKSVYKSKIETTDLFLETIVIF